MEWGTFITVIAAIYLAWFGFNFLFDLFIGGKPKVQTQDGVHYNIGDLMSEEDAPVQIREEDYKESPVAIHKTEDTAAPVDAAGSGHQVENISVEALPPVAVDNTPDWADNIDQDEQMEEKIEIPVQGQPVSVMDYINILKAEAKTESTTITF